MDVYFACGQLDQGTHLQSVAPSRVGRRESLSSIIITTGVEGLFPAAATRWELSSWVVLADFVSTTR